MTRSQFDDDAVHSESIDPTAAAQMLANAARVDDEVTTLVDHHAHARIQRWAPVVVFVYVATLLLIFTAPLPGSEVSAPVPSALYANVLLIPVLILRLLARGAWNRLPISATAPPRGRKLVLPLLAIALVGTALVASIFGYPIAWWACLLVAALASIPAALPSITSLRNAPTPAEHAEVSPRATPLSKNARIVTIALAIYLGVAGAATGFLWFPYASLALSLTLLALVVAGTSRLGLTSIGSEWQRKHWIAFSVSCGLLFALTLIVVRTTWDTPLLCVFGGIAIAAPLAFSVLTSRPTR